MIIKVYDCFFDQLSITFRKLGLESRNVFREYVAQVVDSRHIRLGCLHGFRVVYIVYSSVIQRIKSSTSTIDQRCGWRSRLPDSPFRLIRLTQTDPGSMTWVGESLAEWQIHWCCQSRCCGSLANRL